MTFRVHRFDSVDSTMRIAAGLPLGDVVVADEQTAGQGRHGHSWHSEKGVGLYCSIVLPPTPLLTLALGLATAHVLPATCDLRWPNDVMIGDRKIAGILVNLVGGKAVAGIGINLNHMEFPPELQATSLKLATGAELEPAGLLDALLASIETYTQLEPDDILTLFTRASSYASGRRVTVNLPDGVIHGATRGLNPDGYLMLRKDDGTDTLILAGGVRAAGA
jgi:BirA family transcriptional regulator, biotin operon repressor / biotin---[acetyl-CoA-carboxylase] ligase